MKKVQVTPKMKMRPSLSGYSSNYTWGFIDIITAHKYCLVHLRASVMPQYVMKKRVLGYMARVSNLLPSAPKIHLGIQKPLVWFFLSEFIVIQDTISAKNAVYKQFVLLKSVCGWQNDITFNFLGLGKALISSCCKSMLTVCSYMIFSSTHSRRLKHNADID